MAVLSQHHLNLPFTFGWVPLLAKMGSLSLVAGPESAHTMPSVWTRERDQERIQHITFYIIFTFQKRMQAWGICLFSFWQFLCLFSALLTFFSFFFIFPLVHSPWRGWACHGCIKRTLITCFVRSFQNAYEKCVQKLCIIFKNFALKLMFISISMNF